MNEQIVETGRRKTAVASVWLRPGSGQVEVNHRKFEDYFPLELQRKEILLPLQAANRIGEMDLIIRVSGGGIEGQALACRLGLARALVKLDAELKQEMKSKGFLTRDPRKKERKKYGLRGARKRGQYSKR
jgi:small subunit ribosomal protein S9